MFKRWKFIAAAGTSILAANAGCAGLLGGEEKDGASGGFLEDTILAGGQITGSSLLALPLLLETFNSDFHNLFLLVKCSKEYEKQVDLLTTTGGV